MPLSSLQSVLATGMQNKGLSKDAASSLIKNQTELNAALDKGTSQLNAIKSQASSAINSSLSSLTSNLSSFTSLFGSNPLTSVLTSAKLDALKGPKEADSKIKSLASDASAALANPVAFISKPVNDAIKGIDTLSQGMGIKDYFSSMNSTEISNLAKSMGSSITSSGDVLNSIISSTNDFAAALRNIPNSLASMASPIVAPISSTLNSFSSAIKSGIGNTLASALSSSSLGQVISAGKNLTDSVLGILPNSLSQYIQKFSTSYLSSAVNSLVGDKLSSFNNILSLLSGNFSSDTLLEKLLGLGDSSKYPTSLSSSTNDPGTAQGLSDSMYKAAKTICSKVATPKSTPFQANKDLYDLLMDLAADYGLSDLIRQMSNCTTVYDIVGASTFSTKARTSTDVAREYMDERTVSVLRGKTRSVSVRGDVETYSAIQDVISPSQIKESRVDMVVLVANMPDEQSKLDTLDQVLEKQHITKEQLVYTENIGDQKVIDGITTSAMCANNTTVVDSVLTPEVRVLTQSAMFAYA